MKIEGLCGCEGTYDVTIGLPFIVIGITSHSPGCDFISYPNHSFLVYQYRVVGIISVSYRLSTDRCLGLCHSRVELRNPAR